MKADRIVVGMHSQDGSVSPLDVRLAIDARCPVLVVDGTLTEPMKAGALVHILVAVNFLPASSLGGHPKPAINGHLKTGHFE